MPLDPSPTAPIHRRGALSSAKKVVPPSSVPKGKRSLDQMEEERQSESGSDSDPLSSLPRRGRPPKRIKKQTPATSATGALHLKFENTPSLPRAGLRRPRKSVGLLPSQPVEVPPRTGSASRSRRGSLPDSTYTHSDPSRSQSFPARRKMPSQVIASTSRSGSREYSRSISPLDLIGRPKSIPSPKKHVSFAVTDARQLNAGKTDESVSQQPAAQKRNKFSVYVEVPPLSSVWQRSEILPIAQTDSADPIVAVDTVTAPVPQRHSSPSVVSRLHHSSHRDNPPPLV